MASKQVHLPEQPEQPLGPLYCAHSSSWLTSKNLKPLVIDALDLAGTQTLLIG